MIYQLILFVTSFGMYCDFKNAVSYVTDSFKENKFFIPGQVKFSHKFG